MTANERDKSLEEKKEGGSRRKGMKKKSRGERERAEIWVFRECLDVTDTPQTQHNIPASNQSYQSTEKDGIGVV